MKILMLTPVMLKGHGLPEVVAALIKPLEALGVTCEVGCMESDGSFGDIKVHRIGPATGDVQVLLDWVKADVVIAHGSPYHEVLPHLRGQGMTVAYEHGEPPPEMFELDSAARAKRIRSKRVLVYPHVDHVVAISEFIRHDIKWPQANVIFNGVDHIADLGAKPWLPPWDPNTGLKIGLLMRLGAGEARYKGNDVLPDLRRLVAERGVQASWQVMGRGTKQDAQLLRDQGFEVHLNASDSERERYLRDIDVFVTLSKWEGCNLPLVEAEALGTPGLALDTGSHPEVSPLVFANLDLMATQIAAYADSPELLRAHGEDCYTFVRSRMSWNDAAASLLTLVGTKPVTWHGSPGRALASGSALVWARTTTKWQNARDLHAAGGMRAVTEVALGKFRRRKVRDDR